MKFGWTEHWSSKLLRNAHFRFHLHLNVNHYYYYLCFLYLCKFINFDWVNRLLSTIELQYFFFNCSYTSANLRMHIWWSVPILYTSNATKFFKLIVYPIISFLFISSHHQCYYNYCKKIADKRLSYKHIFFLIFRRFLVLVNIFSKSCLPNQVVHKFAINFSIHF